MTIYVLTLEHSTDYDGSTFANVKAFRTYDAAMAALCAMPYRFHTSYEIDEVELVD
jgi:hypothetical protein